MESELLESSLESEEESLRWRSFFDLVLLLLFVFRACEESLELFLLEDLGLEEERVPPIGQVGIDLLLLLLLVVLQKPNLNPTKDAEKEEQGENKKKSVINALSENMESK